MTETLDQFYARTLSFTQWEFLAEHFHGKARPVIPEETRTRVGMIKRGMIRSEPANTSYPKFTIITEKGHGVMCAAMGMMADMLVSLGYDGITNPPAKPTEKVAYGKCPAPAMHSPDGGLPAATEYRS